MQRARWLVSLADRWGKLPEEIEQMDASNVRLLKIIERGKREVSDA